MSLTNGLLLRSHVALEKNDVALQNEHMTGTEKNGNKNVALEK